MRHWRSITSVPRLSRVLRVLAAALAVAVWAFSQAAAVASVWQVDGPRSAEEQAHLDRLIAKGKRLRYLVDNSPGQRSRERRLRSLSAAAALAAFKGDFAEVLGANGWLTDVLPHGSHISRYSGLYAAQVRTPGEKRAKLLVSTAPLRVPVDGRLRPVDFSLSGLHAGFSPRNPLVPARLPYSLSEEIGVGSGDASLTLAPRGVAASARSGQRVEKSAFYPGAFEDTDVLLQPATLGLRVGLHVRSKAAPESYSFSLPLGLGREANLADGVVTVKQGGQPIWRIEPERATDRRGRPLEAQLRLDGDLLRVEVPHRAPDYAYPALVTLKVSLALPEETGSDQPGGMHAEAGAASCSEEAVTGFQEGLPSTQWIACYGFALAGSGRGGWVYSAYPDGDQQPNYRHELRNDCPPEYAGSRGLCMATINGSTYWGGSYGQFMLTAPPTTYFQSVDFEGSYGEKHHPGGQEWPDQCARLALYPSPGSATVFDTGWGDPAEDPHGYGVYSLNRPLQMQAGGPQPLWAVFRLHNCRAPGFSERLDNWEAWGRLDVAQAILVDETYPGNFSASGPLWDARGQTFRFDPNRTWSGTVAGEDLGSGMGKVNIYVSGEDANSIFEEPVDCDYTHQSSIQPCGQRSQGTVSFPELEPEDEGCDPDVDPGCEGEEQYCDPAEDPECEEEARSSSLRQTPNVSEGWNDICANGSDYAGNAGQVDVCWQIQFDAVPPPEPNVAVEAHTGYAHAYWTRVTGDEDGSRAHTAGAGFMAYQYRHKIGDGAWSDWVETGGRQAPLLEGLPDGAEVTYEVRAVDNVGNTSVPSGARSIAGEQPVLGKRGSSTYATGGEGFFEDLTTNLKKGSLLSQRTDVDVSSLGPDLRLTRAYNSAANDRGGILGYGWELSIETHLAELPDGSVLYDDGQGGLYRFRPGDREPQCTKQTVQIDERDEAVGRRAPPSKSPTFIHCRLAENEQYQRIAGLRLTLRKDDGRFSLNDTQHNVADFDGGGRLASITDQNSNSLTYSYNSSGQLTTAIDAAGRHTALSYDTVGRLSQVADAAGRTTRYRYTSDNELLSVTDAAGRKTCFAYDSSRRLTRTATPKLVAQTGTCKQVSVRDPGTADGEAVILYDSAGRVASLTNERHTGGGNQVAIDGVPIGASTTYEWSESVSCSSAPCVHTPSRATTAYELDANGQAIRQWDPDGRLTTKSYDAALDPTEVVTDAGPGGRQSRTAMTWDADGNLLSRIEPGHSQPTNYRYEDGDLVQKTLPSGRVTTYAYDGRHNLTRETSAPGTPVEASTICTYDARGNLTALTGADARTTTYAYDANSNRSDLRDPATATPSLSVTYNQAGKPAELSDANGNRTSLTWSAAGRLDRQEDVAAGEPAPSHTAAFSYDENAGLTNQSDDDPAGGAASEQETVFEENSQPVDSSFGVSDASPGSRDAQVDQSLSGAGPAATRAVSDGEGYALGHAYEYTFHLSGALWIVARSSTDDYAGLYSYDGDDNALSVERWESDSVSQTSAFDGANRETHREFVSSRYPLTPIIDQDYSYDEDDRLVSVTDRTEAEGNAAYTYDAAGRLVTEVVDGAVTTYGYDADGNRLSTIRDGEATTYSYDDRGLVTQEQTPQGTRFYYYDADGNLARQIDELGGTTTYAWDARSRLAQVTKPDGSRVEFAYQDRTNLRTRKTVKDAQGDLVSATEYQYDSTTGALVAELDATAGGDEPKLVFNYDALGRLVSVTVGPDVEPPTYYYDRSPRGDVLAINNKFGQTTTGGRYRYGAFGETLLRTGTLYNPIRWRGAYYDEETGLYYLRNRYYDPRTGRYLSPDPARLPVPLAQRYAYAANDPVNRAEPAGTAAFAETFDPNPFERPLARTGEPVASVDALKAQEPEAATACAAGLAHYEGRPTPREAMAALPAQGSALVGVGGSSGTVVSCTGR